MNVIEAFREVIASGNGPLLSVVALVAMGVGAVWGLRGREPISQAEAVKRLSRLMY